MKINWRNGKKGEIAEKLVKNQCYCKIDNKMKNGKKKWNGWKLVKNQCYLETKVKLHSKILWTFWMKWGSMFILALKLI